MSRSIEEAALAFDRAMDGCGVPYVVVGGVAVMAWGRPRATRDIDVLVDLSEDDVEAFVAAVEGEGFSVDRHALEMAFKDPAHVTVFDEDSEVHVDLNLARSPLEREEVAAAVTLEFEMGKLRVAPPEEVIPWKLKYGTPRDLEDAESVYVRQQGKLDVEHLEARCRDLGVVDALRAMEERIADASG